MALSMVKGQVEDLLEVQSIRVGVSWKTSGGGKKGLVGWAKKRLGTDLDLCAVALSEGSPKRMAWFDDTDPFDNGSLRTLGDNRTGKGSGDDESVIADLYRMHQSIDGVVFIVSAFKDGVSFTNVSGVTVTVYDDATGIELGSFMPDIDSTRSAIVACKAVRRATGWGVAQVNEMETASTRDQLLQVARKYVR